MCTTFFSGCATRAEIKRFQQQLNYLENSQRAQEKHLDHLDSILVAQGEILRQVNANSNYNLELISQRMKIIEALLTESGSKVSGLRQKLDALQQDMTFAPVDAPKTDNSSGSTDTKNGGTKNSGKNSQPKNDADTVESQASVNAKKLFETAQLDYNKGKFELAKMGFEQFLSLFPNSTLADDAQYSIAECLFVLGKFSDAKKEYLAIRDKYPKSELVAPALFKAGSSAQKLDDVKSAKTLYDELIKAFPNSEEAQAATERLQSLNKKQ